MECFHSTIRTGLSLTPGVSSMDRRLKKKGRSQGCCIKDQFRVTCYTSQLPLACVVLLCPAGVDKCVLYSHKQYDHRRALTFAIRNLLRVS